MKLRQYTSIVNQAVMQEKLMWIVITIGFVILYYLGLLVAAMMRFNEIPNYIEFYNLYQVYGQILEGTPSLYDAALILIDEAWFETGYKDPEYYGVATWSYMLIPPKMILVFVTAMLLATFTVLVVYSRKLDCPVHNRRKMYSIAGLGSGLVGLTSATLSWVVCCATPSWVVGLAMLGLSSSIALWLEPFGKLLGIIGIGLLLWITLQQLKNILKNGERFVSS